MTMTSPPGIREVQFIEDDSECKALLACHGMLNELMPTPPFPRKFCGWKEDGIWYVGGHYYGFEDPSDNSYTVLVIGPGFTDEEVQDLIDAFVENGRDYSQPAFFEVHNKPNAANC